MARLGGLLVLVLTLVFMTVALPMIAAPAMAFHQVVPRQAVEDCTTDLARDLYGLGVRLGVGIPAGARSCVSLIQAGLLPVVLRMGSQYLRRRRNCRDTRCQRDLSVRTSHWHREQHENRRPCADGRPRNDTTLCGHSMERFELMGVQDCHVISLALLSSFR